jgi:hypothetical protein
MRIGEAEDPLLTSFSSGRIETLSGKQAPERKRRFSRGVAGPQSRIPSSLRERENPKTLKTIENELRIFLHEKQK